MRRLLFILLCMMTSAVFAADDDAQLYQVNLIVFTQINTAALQSEHWPNRLIRPDLKNTINLSVENNNDATVDIESTMPGLYQLLKNKKPGLKREVSLLRRNKNYKIILHQAWVQPISNSRHTKWVHIFGGQAYDKKGLIIAKEQLNNDVKPAFWEINGKIKITVLRYFDINSKMHLTLPKSMIANQIKLEKDDGITTTPLQSFTLKQKIRTRSKEIVYFDHPLFGLLIQITPVINDE